MIKSNFDRFEVQVVTVWYGRLGKHLFVYGRFFMHF